MTARLVHRPARTVRPLGQEEPLDVNPPPMLPEGKTAAGIQGLLPMAGAAASMTMMMFFRGSGFAALGAVVMLVSVSAAALFYFTQRGQATRKRKQQRERYLDYLEELREDLRDWEQRYRDRAWLPNPPAGQLLDVIGDPARLWERRRRDNDFLRVRIGLGAMPVRETRMRIEGTPVNPTDPFMLAEARALQRRFSTVAGVPLRANLDRAGDVALIGSQRNDVLGLARTILIQCAATHAPDDLAIAVITPPEREDSWAWLRWLPHVLDRERIGPAGPQPLFAPDAESLAALLADDLSERARRAAQSYRHGSGAAEATTRPRLLVVDDAFGGLGRTLPTPDKGVGLSSLGVTVLHLLSNRLHEPGEISSRITLTSGDEVTVEALRADTSSSVTGMPEPTSQAWAEGLAREIAPLRLSPDSYDDGSGSPPADFLSLLGIDDPSRVDIARLWSPRGERDFLRVPIGVGSLGNPTLLDLKESSQLGMGPHGLCVGATGSGKSELLRTLVLALVTAHSPEQLSMVLVDYKGGATFAPFEDLPHVAGLITNLESDASLVERMYASLDGEVVRRQQVLADADKSTDITVYNMRRAARGNPPDMPPLQHLVLVIDEFGELLTAKPEFIELFLRIGRIGRSIGVHLLLSSQRIEGGKLRGLETYLSYRLGLRTLSELESRTVLDTPDAFHLEPLPGAGYLKVDVSVYEKFKSAYVSGALSETHDAEPVAEGAPQVHPMPRFGSLEVEDSVGEKPRSTRRTTGPTLLSTIVDQLTRAAEPVSPIWLPPLPHAVSLDVACGGFDITSDGLRLRAAHGDGLVAPLGILDDPAAQWQGTWNVDLSLAGGNLMFLGGPGSGKTTALRTLALGLACTHRPTDVGIYGVDLLGSGLRALGDLPHVGGVAGRDDRERIRRTLDEVHAMLDEREQLFRRHQLDSVADLRTARAHGDLAELGCTEVVLLVDGYGQIAGDFEVIESRIFDLLARGGRYGIHVVATARRWNEVRGAQQVSFGNRIELKLTDSAESSVEAKLARTIGSDQLGRALTSNKLFAQVALPRLDSVPDPHGSALAEAAKLVRSTWSGALPPSIRVLPPVLPATELAPPDDRPGIIPFGRFENDFAAAELDLFGRDQHLLALGDSRTGKTNLLRLLTTRLMSRYSSEELVFAVFDPRHGLAGLVPDDYLGGYANNHTLANQLAMAVSKELAKRDPAGSSGPVPKIVLVIDDYDILAASASQPLAPFVPYLASGRDLGLHVLMTRRVMGSARGLFEPFTLGVRESGCLGLLMSGDRSEGQLFPGIRPMTLPVGRGLYIRPGDSARTMQTAYFDPERG